MKMETWSAAVILIAVVAVASATPVSDEGQQIPNIDDEIAVTVIDEENIRLTMIIENRAYYLGENIIIKFEVKNESEDNAWLTDPRRFYLNVYDENHNLIGTWPSPGNYWQEWLFVGPGEWYGENLVWDQSVYYENWTWPPWDNWVIILENTIVESAEIMPLWYCPPPPKYERLELEPGTYYLEGCTYYTKYVCPLLQTPLVEITILPQHNSGSSLATT